MLEYADRAPRIQPPLPIETIEIPAPPDEPQTAKGAFNHLLMPMIMLMGYLLMGAFGGGRNLLFMIPMGLSVIVTAAVSYRNHALEQKQLRELREGYINRLSTLRREMQTHHINQRLYYEHTHPSLEVISEIGHDQAESRLGSRLWERRTFDHDFGSVRLGIGDIASRTVYELKESNAQHNPLFGEAQQLAIDSRVLHNAPVILPLFAAIGDDGKPISARHSIGITDSVGQAERVRNFVRALGVQFAAMHSPVDSQIYVIGSPQSKQDWNWALWLPHTNQHSGYTGDRMCFEPDYTEEERKDKKKLKRESPKKFWARIHKELESRQQRLNDKEVQGDVRLPFMLVIVDNLTPEPWLDNATSEAAVSLILQQGASLGAAILFLVEDAATIPSDCVGVIELKAAGETTNFQYSEIGLNSARFVGVADTAKSEEAEAFAQHIKDKTVRMGYGADLVTSVSILELYENARKIEDLDILTAWERSKKEADWLKVPIGKKSGGDDRELYFYQDADGVHGMIAGTTGSGKSELLLTLIAGLAINYDPSILNFVLVDYKGGAAFEPFRKLPHVVDIVTNLDGKAVDRMFIAIRSELDRRSALLAKYNVKHIVEYRKKGLHLSAEPFPHLFIVVDEFAEMVNDNKDYKDRFDSITRLGRAIGVNLILATQRPSGAVTDQMRSNMKLKICLRVETVDDSRELLGRSDATFLPSNIPGRAYLQVGKDSPELLQIARAGGPYIEPQDNTQVDDIIFEDTHSVDMRGEPDSSAPQEVSIVDRIVEEVRKLADGHEGYDGHAEKQHKPWPDPLPELLPINHAIDAYHLNLEGTTRQKMENEQIIIAPRVRMWMKDDDLGEKALEMRQRWQNGQAIDWQNLNHSNPFQVSIGLIDIPEKAEQRLLSIDITVGPLMVFGAGGWGKTTFLQSLLITLAAQLSPKELHIYALDFGRGGLSALQALPHLARAIEVTEEARVERLLRVLSDEIDKREPKIRAYGSLLDYNRQNPAASLPAIVVVIDNFAEFKETYENQIEALVKLVRAGRSMGIYFIVTADQSGAVPSRVYSLFTQRYALKMASSDDYQAIVGRASAILTETPGRGVVQVERQPCEFHVAVPTLKPVTQNDEKKEETINEPDATASSPKTDVDNSQYMPLYTRLAEILRDAWTHDDRPQKIEPLSAHIPLQTLKAYPRQPSGECAAPIGVRDIDRELAVVDLTPPGTHLLVIGAPVSGKTTALKNLVLGLADRYSPEQVVMILIDPKQTLFGHNGKYTLRNLPHVLTTIADKEEMQEMLKRLDAEFYHETQEKIREYAKEVGLNPDDQFTAKTPPTRHYVFVIDNYDDFGDFEIGDAQKILNELVRKFRDRNLHFVLSGSPDIARASSDELRKRVINSRYALVLHSEESVAQLGGRMSYRISKGEQPAGRGFLVKSGQVILVQVADAHDDSDSVQRLDAEIARIMAHYPHKAQWFFKGTFNTYDKATTQKAKDAQAPQQQTKEDVDISPEVDEIYKQLEEESKQNKGK